MNSINTPDLDAVIDRMDERLHTFTTSEDRRARFLLMYRTFKDEIRKNIRTGRFNDADWAERICCRMGEMYFEADEAYVNDRAACPEPWIYCFDAAQEGRTHLVQDMLLGMNAHINYDLPFCTYDTMKSFDDLRYIRADATDVTFTVHAHIRQRYLDFLLINQIAWESIGLIQERATRRFSRFLQWANVISSSVTKRITEKIICDYRDRAWGHTLLLATAADDEELQQVSRFASRFAMGAAHQVDKLTPKPWQVVWAFWREQELERELSQQEDLVRYLVSKLSCRTTASVARRVLIEYGSVIHPILAHLLDERPTDHQLRRQLFAILGEYPIPEGMSIIANHLDPADPKSFDVGLTQLSQHAARGISLSVDTSRIRRLIDREQHEARKMLRGLRDLKEVAPDALLGATLRRRFKRHLRHELWLYALLHSDKRLWQAGRVLEQSPPVAPEPLIRQLFSLLTQAQQNEFVAPLRAIWEAAPRKFGNDLARERLATLIEDGDEWVQVCALFEMRKRGPDYADLARSLLSSSTGMLQETAFLVSRALLPPAMLRSLAERYLEAENASLHRLAANTLNAQAPAMLSSIEKILFLKNVDLFSGIPSEDLAPIAKMAEEQHFEPGETILEEGEPGEALYIVVEGDVRVRAGPDNQVVAHMGPHDVLGELSLLSNNPCSATCAPTTPTRALRISHDEFLPFLHSYPETSIGLIRVLSNRLRTANRQSANQRAE